MQLVGPNVWTTLALTIHADGRAEPELVGASTFPRHWLYDDGGHLIAKSGLIDFDEWYHHAFGSHSPWGAEDSPALSAEAESAIERQLADSIMRGDAAPNRREVEADAMLFAQDDPGDELYLVLDGMLRIEVDGEAVADVGPGAIVGERALLEGGRRTAAARAVTPCRLAVARRDQVDRAALAAIAEGHRREG